MPETNLEVAPSAAAAPEAKPPAASPAALSLRIIAAAIVLTCIYFASSVVVTLICSIFVAFVLEPGVKLMERLRVPRWLGSLVMVLVMLAGMYLVGYLIYDRVAAFIDELPKITARLKQIASHIQVFTRNIRQTTTDIIPSGPESALPTVRLQQDSPWMQYLVRGIGSVYSFTVTVMFIPFLVFFMLTSKYEIWAATLKLFPSHRRQQAEDVIRGISRMVRQFVLGNVLVALISAAVITPVFAAIDLRYALLLGPLAAFLGLVPYIGVALGVLPPLLMALVQYEHPEENFAVIGITVVLAHFVAVNFLTPKLVGGRVRLNALSVTISMMFWGWLWGGVGLVLAVPITAAFKAVCDNVESLKPYGAWMGEG